MNTRTRVAPTRVSMLHARSPFGYTLSFVIILFYFAFGVAGLGSLLVVDDGGAYRCFFFSFFFRLIQRNYEINNLNLRTL